MRAPVMCALMMLALLEVLDALVVPVLLVLLELQVSPVVLMDPVVQPFSFLLPSSCPSS